MKKFMAPEILINKFDAEDIIATSNQDDLPFIGDDDGEGESE